jgi:hypothetical protein
VVWAFIDPAQWITYPKSHTKRKRNQILSPFNPFHGQLSLYTNKKSVLLTVNKGRQRFLMLQSAKFQFHTSHSIPPFKLLQNFSSFDSNFQISNIRNKESNNSCKDSLILLHTHSFGSSNSKIFSLQFSPYIPSPNLWVTFFQWRWCGELKLIVIIYLIDTILVSCMFNFLFIFAN